MRLKLTYDPIERQFMVETKSFVGTPISEPLREFYIRQRIEAGISITKLALDSGLDRGQLRNIEFVQSTGKYSKSIASMLAALETLGFILSIEG